MRNPRGSHRPAMLLRLRGDRPQPRRGGLLMILTMILTMAGMCLLSGTAFAQTADPDADSSMIGDVEYAQVGGKSLRLDLYLPKDIDGPPLVVWVHGGAWRGGTKDNMPLKWLVPEGFAVASIDYRLSTQARFPAQVHDCKAAIRYLRSQQSRYGYDARRIAIAGSSAGGHLAALVGTTNHHAPLEGRVGDHLDTSSSVQAVVDYFGPTNFMTILKQSTPHGLGVRVPALQLLLGGQPENVPELARLASPVFHVDRDDPPVLILHGDQDPQVPINQSHELQGACQQHAVAARLEVVHGAAHGGELFFDDQRRDLVQIFLAERLQSNETP